MSEKRRDSKKRILRDGEYQREDGRYEYRYTDNLGNRKSVYSWKLVETDKLPAGKRSCKALRTIEDTLNELTKEGIDIFKNKAVTLNDCHQEYLSLLKNVKEITKQNYEEAYDRYIRNELGNKLVSEITYVMIKKLYQKMAYEKKYKLTTISIVDALLNAAFDLAIKNNVIKNNPCQDAMKEIRKDDALKNNTGHAMSGIEQERFLNFLSTDTNMRKWKPLFTFLLGTGCRISEALALKWEDCDFENGVIYIRHTITRYKNEDGVRQKHIGTPKTKKSNRMIPMLTDVRKLLLAEQERQKELGIQPETIDGYSGFVFVNKRGCVYSINTANYRIRTTIKKYNDAETANAVKEGREPILISKYTPHSLRHTFCTRFCEVESNVKVIQEIMGHSNIYTTMNIYNDAMEEVKTASFKNLDKQIKIV